jgi:hypothetical protein
MNRPTMSIPNLRTLGRGARGPFAGCFQLIVASVVLAIAASVSSTGASAAALSAALVDELQPLYPDSRIEEVALAEPVRLDVARGTIAGVHLLLCDLPADVRLQVEAVGSDAWPTTGVQFYRLLDVPVEINSGLHTRTEKWDGRRNPHVIRRAPFRIFEVLRPLEPEERTAGSVVALAAQVVVPADTKPGDYDLEITVRAGKIRAEANEKALGMLTDEQKKKYEGFKGKEFKIEG